MSYASVESQHSHVHHVSLGGYDLVFQASGLDRDLHHVPYTSFEPQQRGMRLMPHDRCELGVQSPELDRLRIVPQRTFEPLRLHVLVVSCADAILGQRYLQSPPGARR
jgi:hypothetical protein